MTHSIHQMNQDRENLPERIELARRAKLDYFVILVFLPWNKVTPFVTWNEYHGNTSTGHYFQDLHNALADFDERTKGPITDQCPTCGR